MCPLASLQPLSAWVQPWGLTLSRWYRLNNPERNMYRTRMVFGKSTCIFYFAKPLAGLMRTWWNSWRKMFMWITILGCMMSYGEIAIISPMSWLSSCFMESNCYLVAHLGGSKFGMLGMSWSHVSWPFGLTLYHCKKRYVPRPEEVLMQPEWLKDAFVITLNPDIVVKFAINLVLNSRALTQRYSFQVCSSHRMRPWCVQCGHCSIAGWVALGTHLAVGRTDICKKSRQLGWYSGKMRVAEFFMYCTCFSPIWQCDVWRDLICITFIFDLWRDFCV